jgi:multiple sugar transport system substrate-binding protein
LLNYRISWMKEAGYDTFPTDFHSYLKMCQKLSKSSHPPGFALSHATGDAVTWPHNLLCGFGGKMVDEKNKVAINSAETVAAIEYMIELNITLIEGTRPILWRKCAGRCRERGRWRRARCNCCSSR